MSISKCNNNLPQLPSEVWNIIWEFYWKDIYKNKVLEELISPYKVCDSVYKYMCCHGFCNIQLGINHSTDRLHYYYYRNHNDKLKKILRKKSGIFLFCKTQDTCYKNMLYILNCGMLNNISDDYKYICAFYILFSIHNYQILHYFKELSKLKIKN